MARRVGPWVTVACALAILAVLLWFGDVGKVADAIAGVGAWHVAGALGLVTVAYALRFAKWHLLVRRLALPVRAGRSVQVFLSGLMMIVTPAKVGEVWKSVLLAGDGIPVARSLPAVAVERGLDLVAVAVLGGLGLAVLTGEPWAVPLVALAAVAAVAALRWRRLWHGLLDRMGRLGRRRRLARTAAFLTTAYDGAHALLALRTLLPALSIALVAWTLEGLALWLLLEGLSAPLAPMLALAAFCLGTMAGIASLLPGGLGTAEAGMVAVLVAEGVATDAAVAATFLVRVCTLGYGALLGVLASLAWPRPAGVAAATATDPTGPTTDPRTDHSAGASPGSRPGSGAAQDGGVMDGQRSGDGLEPALHGTEHR